MLPDRVSNPGPLAYESGALPIALCGQAPGIVCSSGGSKLFQFSGLPCYEIILRKATFHADLLFYFFLLFY